MSALLDIDPLYSFPLCEQLALEALILEGPSGEIVFRKWLDSVDFENMRYEVTLLVPALFDRYARQYTKTPYFPRMKGLYRQSFARNASLMHAAWHALVGLQEQGIDILVFKGASLAREYYSSVSIRPMGDIDILVPPHQYELANEILQKNGWKYRHSEEIRRQVEHSSDYINALGQGLDLHVRSLLEVRDPAFDQELLLRAQPLDWGGALFLMLSPEDEALITIVNAMREWDNIKLLWVYDLARILEINPALDWTKIWKQAGVYGLDKLVFHGLQIAFSVRGLEKLYSVMSEYISSSPDFERDYMREALVNGISYGIDKSQWHSILGSTDTEGPIGSLRIFETEQSIIKALYLEMEHLHLIPFFFKINDLLIWKEICSQLPSTGEGVIEFPLGLLKLHQIELPNEAYKIDLSLDQNLPSTLLPLEKLTIKCSIVNKSDFPWPLAGVSKNYFGLSWHVFSTEGLSLIWDNRREYLPPAMFARKKSIVFLKAGAQLQSQIYFQAPEKAGEYRIHFDVVHERIQWFSQTNESLPVWSLSVRAKEVEEKVSE